VIELPAYFKVIIKPPGGRRVNSAPARRHTLRRRHGMRLPWVDCGMGGWRRGPRVGAGAKRGGVGAGAKRGLAQGLNVR